MVDLLLQQKYDLLGKKVEKWHDHGFAKNPLNNGLGWKIQLLCSANNKWDAFRFDQLTYNIQSLNVCLFFTKQHLRPKQYALEMVA